MDKRGTHKDGPKDNKIDDNAQSVTSEKQHRQTLYESKKKEQENS